MGQAERRDPWVRAFESVLRLERSHRSAPGLDVATRRRCAQEYPSGFSAFIPGVGGQWAAVSAHVVGIGLDTSLRALQIWGLLQALCRTMDRPDEILVAANGFFADEMPMHRFTSALIATVDPRTRVLTYANAGSSPWMLRRADGEFGVLAPTGPVLGVLADAPYRSSPPLDLASGDIVLGCGDGVTDLHDGEGLLFGEDRLRGVLCRGAEAGCDAAGILEGLVCDVDAFRGEAYLQEELVTLAIRVL